jgi:hypothetical protein
MAKVFFLFGFLLLAMNANAQSTLTLKGQVVEEVSNKPVTGVTVYSKSTPNVGASTDIDGHFILSLPAGKHTIVSSFIGYSPLETEIDIVNNYQEVLLKMKENTQQLDEGVERIEMIEMAKTPALFGERDMIKSIRLLPGVKSDGESQDSIYHSDKSHYFKPKEAIIPVSLIAIGSWGVCNGWSQSVNHSTKDYMTNIRNNRYFTIDDYMQYIPVISFSALDVFGVKTEHNLKEKLLITGISYLTMGIMVNTVKYSTRIKRPDSSSDNSFPSGHTATAFMGAELVRKEYGTVYGIGAYTIACSVAFLKLYNNRHWLNDVVAGAGMGILSAQIGYWLLPGTSTLFGLNKTSVLKNVSFTPYYDYDIKGLCGNLSLRF